MGESGKTSVLAPGVGVPRVPAIVTQFGGPHDPGESKILNIYKQHRNWPKKSLSHQFH